MVLHTDYYHTQLSVLGVGSTVEAMSAGGGQFRLPRTMTVRRRAI